MDGDSLPLHERFNLEHDSFSFLSEVAAHPAKFSRRFIAHLTEGMAALGAGVLPLVVGDIPVLIAKYQDGAVGASEEGAYQTCATTIVA